MSRRPRDRVKIATDALYLEKVFTFELIRALQEMIVINEALRERIAELEQHD